MYLVWLSKCIHHVLFSWDILMDSLNVSFFAIIHNPVKGNVIFQIQLYSVRK